MDANKVYKDIVYLLYNVLDQEKLRYELFKDSKYREQFIALVNDLLTLEKEHETSFNDEQWAAAFGRAIVVIAQIPKQRFERQNNKAIEKIYEDYSKMVAYTTKNFEVKSSVLTNSSLKFSKEDVAYNGKLSQETINKYEELAKEAEATKQAEQAKTDENIFVNDQKKENPNNQQQAGWNPYQGQPNGQAFENFAQNVPQNPMQDPRYYPYDRKPKAMPWLKLDLGIIVIISAIILIVASAFAMSKSVNLKSTFPELMNWTASATYQKSNSSTELIKVGALGGIDNNFSLVAGSRVGFMQVIIYIFYCIPAVYVGWECFSKPKSLANKYRIGYWPIIFMVVFFALSIIDIYQYASVGQMNDSWYGFISSLVDKDKLPKGVSFDDEFNNWWATKIKSAEQVQAVSILMDVAIGFLGLSVIFGIAICFVNPKIDRMKYQKAMNEYQRAVMSAMQGIPYTMDQSLFENDDDVIIHNKSKFTLWWEKVWDKIAFWKHKKNKNK